MEIFKVLFYGGDRKNGARDFLFKSDKNQSIKIFSQIDHLKEFGLSRSNPNLKKLVGTPFWEVRILGKDNIRMFCAMVDGNVVVFHIFKKKTQKTPKNDIKLALKLYNELKG